tara:strand:+ start:477 stop:848 length:372 start_codon:yes stop_codon:yes gene_type:complete
MAEIIFVSLGGILGANARFKIYNKLEKLNLNKYFFVLIINTFSSFSLGLFLSIIEKFSSFIYSYQLVLFFSIGFLGSLSTFSSFIYDLFELCLHLKFFKALKLFLISSFLGIIAFAIGFLLAN